MPSNPAQVLGRQAKKWAQEAADTSASKTSSNAPMSRHAVRLTARLLSLATDIVHSNIIAESFSTDEWCEAVIVASELTPSSAFKRLVFKSLHSTAVNSVATLGPHCSQKHFMTSTLATAEQE
jgi:hypothetical protein